MARYEGMDTLLGRVRQTLGVMAPMNSMEAGTPEPAPPDPHFEAVLSQAGSLLRDVELLRELVAARKTGRFSLEQEIQIGTILTRVRQSLRRCEAALEDGG
jgi:hypothetical protein